MAGTARSGFSGITFSRAALIGRAVVSGPRPNARRMVSSLVSILDRRPCHTRKVVAPLSALTSRALVVASEPDEGSFSPMIAVVRTVGGASGAGAVLVVVATHTVHRDRTSSDDLGNTSGAPEMPSSGPRGVLPTVVESTVVVFGAVALLEPRPAASSADERFIAGYRRPPRATKTPPVSLSITTAASPILGSGRTNPYTAKPPRM